MHKPVTYPEFFWADRYIIHQTHEGTTMAGAERKNFKICEIPDALKMHSAALLYFFLQNIFQIT